MGKVKQWKTGGEEDKFISKLIRQGKINKNTTPASLKTDYPKMFENFSLNVLRNHLNILKRSNGLYLDGDDDEEEDEPEDPANQAAIDLCSDGATAASCVSNINQNYPILCDLFKDPDNQFERVVMAVLLPSGAQNPRVELSDDGMIAFVKYAWPDTMFKMDDLFKKQLAAKQITIHHPKILCLKNALEKVRKRVDLCPESVIKVNLPIKVQTAIDSWSKGGIKRDDGTHIAYAEFKGYIKEYNKKSNDAQLIFNM